jgi:hypothetical protein
MKVGSNAVKSDLSGAFFIRGEDIAMTVEALRLLKVVA